MEPKREKGHKLAFADRHTAEYKASDVTQQVGLQQVQITTTELESADAFLDAAYSSSTIC
jgi:hypothetical protein